ncbi:MAG: hypothetical protein AAFO80_05570 [Pseudomonadota bacterium]
MRFFAEQSFLAVVALLCAMPAAALTLADCDRTTHVSHGGEGGHRDLGAGRVLYGEWWSQEGVYIDLVVANCATGQRLRTRTREEYISDRAPFDRTDTALGIIETELGAAPELFSLTRLARALEHTGEDIEVATLEAEPCACAAVYPEMKGDRTPFALN